MGYERGYLQQIEKAFLLFIKNESVVDSLFGIGSYYTGSKEKLGDLDYVIKLNVEFNSPEVVPELYEFSNRLEEIKDKFKNNKGETLINVFLEDSSGKKLNSVDLWFIKNRKENIEDNIKDREGQIYYKRKVKLMENIRRQILEFLMETYLRDDKRVDLDKIGYLIEKKFNLETYKGFRNFQGKAKPTVSFLIKDGDEEVEIVIDDQEMNFNVWNQRRKGIYIGNKTSNQIIGILEKTLGKSKESEIGDYRDVINNEPVSVDVSDIGLNNE